ncbi:L-threonylcarbamoyladenylate synthase [Paenibacillus polymyxa]|uniref:L-threonylcarbamoyladenylate synthase n=1 Tax=Paenibacillus polymyxa TaxID=1406 RepID=UPI0005CE94DB|nr:L-threonylcarbamoyladenylate synthase [Paenibacillus polymyxa]KAE8561949.1 threonylcarbamoyl-AMP synthase [Paenibacillus polymyxa]KJD40348.1 translation factor [Paenibacillus polymyxa]MBE3647443.1 threonylcarbamoyl-AMP synthase [Paenibacillus polymyxa]MCJ1220133.1 L-threonylcarbamoyladenylate synthase [Paenibacillus polymyxa]MEE4578328.1 L-threonylcarbamoyladenylate synthase [Paenibacillus polymyxa]
MSDKMNQMHDLHVGFVKKESVGQGQAPQSAHTHWWDVRCLVPVESTTVSATSSFEVEKVDSVDSVNKTDGDGSDELSAGQALIAAEKGIREAAVLLQAGETVAFPTETVYGLGADARSTKAVEAVFAAKGRPSDNPLIVHISDAAQLKGMVAEINDTARALMNAFWPGPLTLVLPVVPQALSSRVTAGLDTVGVRMPDHPIALRLITEAGCPLAAPSANRSGRPSPTLAQHVLEDLEGRIGGILDGGPTGVGLESTVVQAGDDGTVTILRPGGVTAEQLAAVARAVVLDPALADTAGQDADSLAPRSPGMKYTHYAPRGRLSVVQGPSPVEVTGWIRDALAEATARGERTAVLAFDDHAAGYAGERVYTLGKLDALHEAAQRLYGVLRRCDEDGVTYILAEACPPKGLGDAVMNRLLKAAGHRIIQL